MSVIDQFTQYRSQLRGTSASRGFEFTYSHIYFIMGRVGQLFRLPLASLEGVPFNLTGLVAASTTASRPMSQAEELLRERLRTVTTGVSNFCVVEGDSRVPTVFIHRGSVVELLRPTNRTLVGYTTSPADSTVGYPFAVHPHNIGVAGRGHIPPVVGGPATRLSNVGVDAGTATPGISPPPPVSGPVQDVGQIEAVLVSEIFDKKNILGLFAPLDFKHCPTDPYHICFVSGGNLYYCDSSRLDRMRPSNGQQQHTVAAPAAARLLPTAASSNDGGTGAPSSSPAGGPAAGPNGGVGPSSPESPLVEALLPTVPLTRLGREDNSITFATADYISSEEFGRFTGYLWSPAQQPKSSRTAILLSLVDSRKVPRHALINKEDEVVNEIFPRVGETNCETSLIVLRGGPLTAISSPHGTSSSGRATFTDSVAGVSCGVAPTTTGLSASDLLQVHTPQAQGTNGSASRHESPRLRAFDGSSHGTATPNGGGGGGGIGGSNGSVVSTVSPLEPNNSPVGPTHWHCLPWHVIHRACPMAEYVVRFGWVSADTVFVTLFSRDQERSVTIETDVDAWHVAASEGEALDYCFAANEDVQRRHFEASPFCRKTDPTAPRFEGPALGVGLPYGDVTTCVRITHINHLPWAWVEATNDYHCPSFAPNARLTAMHRSLSDGVSILDRLSFVRGSAPGAPPSAPSSSTASSSNTSPPPTEPVHYHIYVASAPGERNLTEAMLSLLPVTEAVTIGYPDWTAVTTGDWSVEMNSVKWMQPAPWDGSAGPTDVAGGAKDATVGSNVSAAASSDVSFVYFLANKDDPLCIAVYRVRLWTETGMRLSIGEPERITPVGECVVSFHVGCGLHGVHVVAYVASTLCEPSFVGFASASTASNWSDARVLTGRLRGSPEGGSALSASDLATTLSATSVPMIAVTNFRSPLTGASVHAAIFAPDPLLVPAPAGGRPMILSVYAGPHTRRISKRFDLRCHAMHQYLSREHGIVVVAVDGSASVGRCLQHQAICKKRMGQYETAEHDAFVKDFIDAATRGDPAYQLVGPINPSRVAVTGWSYGGYATLLAMSQSTCFKLGVAGAPVGDWLLYDTGYTERYMGLLPAEAETYAKGAVATYAAGFPNQFNRVFIAHGLADENVHFVNSTSVVRGLVKHNKPYVLWAYPGERHRFVQNPASQLHFDSMSLRVFVDLL